MVINYHQLKCKVTSVYTAIVIPTAIYACETWKRTVMIAHRLDVFHCRCLRVILGISWRDHVTNEEVMTRAGMERLQDIVTTRRRKMAGHALRLQRERSARTAMYTVKTTQATLSVYKACGYKACDRTVFQRKPPYTVKTRHNYMFYFETLVF